MTSPSSRRKDEDPSISQVPLLRPSGVYHLTEDASLSKQPEREPWRFSVPPAESSIIQATP